MTAKSPAEDPDRLQLGSAAGKRSDIVFRKPIRCPSFRPPGHVFSVGFGGGKRSGLVSIVQLESAAGKRSNIVFPETYCFSF
jgi:hypothetical protein